MMPIGSRPVLWHIMRYFAHFGHTEFILCLGHGANAVKDYFLDYRETASNDFVLTKGGQHVDMLSTDISDWTITFIDTGMDTRSVSGCAACVPIWRATSTSSPTTATSSPTPR